MQFTPSYGREIKIENKIRNIRWTFAKEERRGGGGGFCMKIIVPILTTQLKTVAQKSPKREEKYCIVSFVYTQNRFHDGFVPSKNTNSSCTQNDAWWRIKTHCNA